MQIMHSESSRKFILRHFIHFWKQRWFNFDINFVFQWNYRTRSSDLYLSFISTRAWLKKISLDMKNSSHLALIFFLLLWEYIIQRQVTITLKNEDGRNSGKNQLSQFGTRKCICIFIMYEKLKLFHFLWI